MVYFFVDWRVEKSKRDRNDHVKRERNSEREREIERERHCRGGVLEKKKKNTQIVKTEIVNDNAQLSKNQINTKIIDLTRSHAIIDIDRIYGCIS